MTSNLRDKSITKKVSKISIVKVDKNPCRKDIQKTVFKSLNLIGGIQSVIRKGGKVLVKPNAGSETHWERGAVTNPYVVEAVIRIAFEAGAEEVVIGEASQVGTDTKKVYELNQYTGIAEDTGARLLDLNDDEPVTVKINGKILRKVRVFKTALESDTIISIPVVKTHVLAGVTLGLKNMKGLIPESEKKRFHMIGLDNSIADLQLAIKPDLTVVDCLLAMGGLGAPVHLSKPVEPGLIISGTNPVAVDATTCRIIGINPYEIKHLVYSSEHNIGPLEESFAELVGEPMEEIVFNLEKPSYELKEFQGKNLYINQQGACSGCIGALYSALKLCMRNGELNNIPKTMFSIGAQTYTSKFTGAKISIGNCQRDNQKKGKYVPGCPPLVIQIRDEIKNLNTSEKNMQ